MIVCIVDGRLIITCATFGQHNQLKMKGDFQEGCILNIRLVFEIIEDDLKGPTCIFLNFIFK